jgi:hypothetical protein
MGYKSAKYITVMRGIYGLFFRLISSKNRFFVPLFRAFLGVFLSIKSMFLAFGLVLYAEMTFKSPCEINLISESRILF